MKHMHFLWERPIRFLCILLLTSAAAFLAGCGGEKMIGPRTENAWKQYEEDQKTLVETWGETEIYAYITTIMDDMY